MPAEFSVVSVIQLSMEVIYPTKVGEKIRYRSVLPSDLDARIGGNAVQIRRYVGPIEFPPSVDPRALTVYVTADSTIAAAEAALDATEWVTDYLAFSFSCPVFIRTQHIEALGRQDACVGEPMDIPKFRKTAVHLEVTRQDPFVLIQRPEGCSENERAALRWYHKGLETPYDVDRFIFFWIALEILAKADSAGLIPTPFRHSCGHEIHQCPGCGESLARPPPGEAARVAQFMNQLGLSDAEIKPIRDFRQIVHGKGKLTLSGTRQVDRYNEVLRFALNLALKRTLGIPDAAPPIVRPSLHVRNGFMSYRKADPSGDAGEQKKE
jgi:hypothetical protein